MAIRDFFRIFNNENEAKDPWNVFPNNKEKKSNQGKSFSAAALSGPFPDIIEFDTEAA